MDYRHVILIISVIYYVSCSPYRIETFMKRDRPVCGDQLKFALRLVCHGNYAAGATKKSDNDLLNPDDYEDIEEHYNDDRKYEFPFVRKDDMFAMLPRKRQREHGIVDECCLKSCSAEHMRLYCAY